MGHNTVSRDSITIASGETDTEAVDVRAVTRGVFHAPAGPFTGTVTLQSSPDGSTGWTDLSFPGLNGNNFAAAPYEFTINEALLVDLRGVAFIRIHSSGAEGADRDFGVSLGENF